MGSRLAAYCQRSKLNVPNYLQPNAPPRIKFIEKSQRTMMKYFEDEARYDNILQTSTFLHQLWSIIATRKHSFWSAERIRGNDHMKRDIARRHKHSQTNDTHTWCIVLTLGLCENYNALWTTIMIMTISYMWIICMYNSLHQQGGGYWIYWAKYCKDVHAWAEKTRFV